MSSAKYAAHDQKPDWVPTSEHDTILEYDASKDKHCRVARTKAAAARREESATRAAIDHEGLHLIKPAHPSRYPDQDVLGKEVLRELRSGKHVDRDLRADGSAKVTTYARPPQMHWVLGEEDVPPHCSAELEDVVRHWDAIELDIMKVWTFVGVRCKALVAMEEEAARQAREAKIRELLIEKEKRRAEEAVRIQEQRQRLAEAARKRIDAPSALAPLKDVSSGGAHKEKGGTSRVPAAPQEKKAAPIAPKGSTGPQQPQPPKTAAAQNTRPTSRHTQGNPAQSSAPTAEAQPVTKVPEGEAQKKEATSEAVKVADSSAETANGKAADVEHTGEASSLEQPRSSPKKGKKRGNIAAIASANNADGKRESVPKQAVEPKSSPREATQTSLAMSKPTTTSPRDRNQPASAAAEGVPPVMQPDAGAERSAVRDSPRPLNPPTPRGSKEKPLTPRDNGGSSKPSTPRESSKPTTPRTDTTATKATAAAEKPSPETATKAPQEPPAAASAPVVSPRGANAAPKKDSPREGPPAQAAAPAVSVQKIPPPPPKKRNQEEDAYDDEFDSPDEASPTKPTPAASKKADPAPTMAISAKGAAAASDDDYGDDEFADDSPTAAPVATTATTTSKAASAAKDAAAAPPPPKSAPPPDTEEDYDDEFDDDSPQKDARAAKPVAKAPPSPDAGNNYDDEFDEEV